MSNLRKRLVDVEEQKAFRDWHENDCLFKGRSRDGLMFFSVYGYFAESLEGQLPERQEFTVGGIRIVIIAEWV